MRNADMDPCGLWESPSGTPGKENWICMSPSIGVCVYEAKVKMGKSAGTLAWVKVIAPNHLVGIFSFIA